MSKIFQQVKKAISNKVKGVTKKISYAAAAAAKDSLQGRLNAGRGLDDKKMPDLTPRYARRKGKGSVRNLYDTGFTRSSIQLVEGAYFWSIKITNAKAKKLMEYHHRRFPCWGLSPNDKQARNKAITQAILGR